MSAVALASATVGSAVAASFDAPHRARGRASTACAPHFDWDPVVHQASPDTLGPSLPGAASSGPALEQEVVVQVPPGRLYLDPDRVTIPVRHGHGSIPGFLIADLREDRPGWALDATLVGITVAGAEVAGTVAIHADNPWPIVGEHHGIKHVGRTSVALGECATLVTAATGHGWGSYRAGGTIHVDLPDGTPKKAAVEVTLQLHLS